MHGNMKGEITGDSNLKAFTSASGGFELHIGQEPFYWYVAHGFSLDRLSLSKGFHMPV